MSSEKDRRLIEDHLPIKAISAKASQSKIGTATIFLILRFLLLCIDRAKKIRQRPTLPRRKPRSTIGAEELNFRVRYGNGCFLLAIATGKGINQHMRAMRKIFETAKVDHKAL